MDFVQQLETPNFIVDLDIMEKNIQNMAAVCRQYGKALCPMVKTHKCTEIVLLQQQSGATSFLAGTIKEAEKMADAGITDIMMAYPVAGAANIRRIMDLMRRIHVVICFDSVETALLMEEQLARENLTADCVIIIDCGLHRLGVNPSQAVVLAKGLQSCPHLHFVGITSHPGHVYGVSGQEGIAEVAHVELEILAEAKQELQRAGFPVELVATGCTPTAMYELQSSVVDIIRPGNYVFNDALQIALGVASIEQCALTVLATVTAHPAPDRYIIDAGTKCFGLDQGAHNISLVQGFGIVKGHPELLLESLSEEIGKIRVSGTTSIQVGDVLEVIPNHACVVANMTNYLTGCRNGVVERRLYIDARGGI